MVARLCRYWIAEPLAHTPGGVKTWALVGATLVAVEAVTGSAVQTLAVLAFAAYLLINCIRLFRG